MQPIVDSKLPGAGADSRHEIAGSRLKAAYTGSGMLVVSSRPETAVNTQQVVERRQQAAVSEQQAAESR